MSWKFPVAGFMLGFFGSDVFLVHNFPLPISVVGLIGAIVINYLVLTGRL